MNCRTILYVLFAMVLTVARAQENWEQLNPDPSSEKGIAIHFLSQKNGVYLDANTIYTTTDGGDNWEHKIPFFAAGDMAFSGSTGVVVGSNGELMKTDDGGISWGRLFVGRASEQLKTVNVLHPDTLVTASERTMFRSKDGGDSWDIKELPEDQVNSISFTDYDIGHAAASSGRMYKTTDGGDTWYITADYGDFSPQFTLVHFRNHMVGFAVRSNRVYKSTDGGETWNEVNGSPSHKINRMQFVDEQLGFGAGDFGVYKTVDGGDHWIRIGVDKSYIENTNMYGIYFFDADSGFAVGSRGRIAQTENSGENWDLYSSFDDDIQQIEVLEDGRIVVRVGSHLHHSTDNGEHWEYLGTIPLDARLGEFSFVSGQVGYILSDVRGSTPKKLYKTTDGGVTWTQPDNYGMGFDTQAYSLEFVNEDTGFISGGFNQRRLYKTTDGGNIWRAVLTETMRDIQFLDEQNGYALRVGSSIGRLYRTTDGGENWTIALEIDDYLEAMHFLDKDNGFVVGNDGIMWKTVDGGDSWQEVRIPYAYYKFVKFLNKNVGYLLDDKHRLQRTEDGGLNWEQQRVTFGTEDLAFKNSTEIFITGSNGRIHRSGINVGAFTLNVRDAREIGAYNATVDITAASNSGALSELRLEYGIEERFDQHIDLEPSILEAEENAFITVPLSGLEAETEYSYRVVGVHDGAAVSSLTAAFRTKIRYNLQISQIRSITANTASIRAHAMTNDLPLTGLQFEFGTDRDNFPIKVNADPAEVVTLGYSAYLALEMEGLVKQTVYYVRLAGTFGEEQVYSEPVLFETRPNLDVVYHSPVVLSDTEIRLKALLSAHAATATEMVFEYGADDFSAVQAINLDSISKGTYKLVEAALAGLDNSRIYQYRVRATMDGEYEYGETQYFSTGEFSWIREEEVLSTKRYDAHLRAKAFTSSSTFKSLMLEYGLDGQFDQLRYVIPNFISRNNTKLISAQLHDLQPGSTYSYRFKGTDGQDVVHYSEEGSFSTHDKLPADNFKITATDETCNNKSNGSLSIQAEVSSDYVLAFYGTEYSFIDSFTLENLAPGDYSFCIYERGESRDYCYDFRVDEASSLDAKTSQYDNKEIRVEISSGTAPYTVRVNEKQYQFTERFFSFKASRRDRVIISTKYECEGVLTIETDITELRDIYNNPVSDDLNISVEEDQQEIEIHIYDFNGRLLKTTTQFARHHQLALDLKEYPSGVYFIKIIGTTERTHKILKR